MEARQDLEVSVSNESGSQTTAEVPPPGMMDLHYAICVLASEAKRPWHEHPSHGDALKRVADWLALKYQESCRTTCGPFAVDSAAGEDHRSTRSFGEVAAMTNKPPTTARFTLEAAAEDAGRVGIVWFERGIAEGYRRVLSSGRTMTREMLLHWVGEGGRGAGWV